MKSVLKKCEIEDFEYLSEVLDSYASLTDDKGRKALVELLKVDNSHKSDLVDLVDKQIRYYGSSDAAYLVRSVLKDDAGVTAVELVEDVCSKLKISVKKGGSLESRLERLALGAVEKELRNKSPADLASNFKKMGVADTDTNLILEHLKKSGEVAIIPIMIELLGPKVALGIVESIIVGVIATIIGKEAAKILVKELVKRNPWLNALGPIMWVASGVWVAFDLQGPAYRKTVPICLYLGVVALRDGVEIEVP